MIVKHIQLYSLAVLFLLSFSACDHPLDKTLVGNCSDGTQNQYEEDVDCGGPCTPCSNCNDGVQNGGETGIDCGGACESCAPTCSLASAQISFTINPPTVSSQLIDYQTITYDGNTSNDLITFGVDNGISTILTRVKVYLYDNLDLSTYLAINQTAVFKTVEGSSFDIKKASNIIVQLTGNTGFTSYGQTVAYGQSVFITRISTTKYRMRFCSAKAGNDTFDFDATFR